MIDSFAAHTIAALRDLPDAEQVENNTHIVPEIYFSWDAEQAEVSITLSKSDGCLLDANVKVSGQPRWLGLNIGLGDGTLYRGDQVVVVMDLASEMTDKFQLALISSRDGKRVDTLLEEPIGGLPKGVIRTIVHNIHEDDAHEGVEAYHTLAIRLPAHSHSLRLNDLRVMIVPRAKGVRAAPRNLSDFA